MAGEIETYQDALSALQRHEEAVQKTIETIREFLTATSRNWKTIVVNEAAMPTELVMSAIATTRSDSPVLRYVLQASGANPTAVQIVAGQSERAPWAGLLGKC